jgi:serine protease Do
VLVARAEPDDPAAKVGLQAGDIILEFNGTAMDKRLLISRYWSAILSQGVCGTLTVWRKSRNHDFLVTIVELAADKVATNFGGGKKPQNEQVANARGLVVSDLTDTKKKDLDIDGGV